MGMDLWSRVAHMLPALLQGAWTALQIAGGAMIIALLGGLLLATMRTFSRSQLVRGAVSVYVEWLRNVPALTHLFIIYFGLPSIGIRLPAIPAAIIGLGLIGAAVLADVFRSGFRALHIGQSEAALAVGMTPYQVWRHILLPQALRTTLPPLGNYAAQLIKDTSIASAIAAPEIMFFARNLVTSTFDTTLIYLIVIGIYIAIIMPVAWGFMRLERLLKKAS
jgi:polar amino acid transport system permease protein